MSVEADLERVKDYCEQKISENNRVLKLVLCLSLPSQYHAF